MVASPSGKAFANVDTSSFVYGAAAGALLGTGLTALITMLSGGNKDNGSAKPSPKSPSPVPEEKDTPPLISPTLLEVRQPEINDVALELSRLRSVTPQIHYLEYVLSNKGDQTLDISKVDGFEGDGDNTITRDKSISENCQQTLGSNETCTIKLAVVITKEGEISKRINIGNNDATYFTALIEFSVIAAPIPPTPASLEVRQPEIRDVVLKSSRRRSVTPQVHYLEYVLNNTSKDQTFDISRVDGFEDDNNTITRDGSISTNCQQTLRPTETCTIKLVVAITEEGEISKKINIGNDDAPYFFTAPIKFSVIPEAEPTALVALERLTKNLQIKFTREPKIKSPMKLIGTTGLSDSKQILEYTIKNTSYEDIKSLKISGYSKPIIKRDYTVEDNCGTTLASGASCNIRLIANPTIARAISQELNITAMGSSKDASNSQNITRPIKIEVNYEPYLLITKDMVKPAVLVLLSIPESVLEEGEDYFQTIFLAYRRYGGLPILIKHGASFEVYGYSLTKDPMDPHYQKVTEIPQLRITKIDDTAIHKCFSELPFVENEAITITRPMLTRRVVDAIETGDIHGVPTYSDPNFTVPLVINAIDENIPTNGVLSGTNYGVLILNDNKGELIWSINTDEICHPSITDIYVVGSYVCVAINCQSFVDNKLTELEKNGRFRFSASGGGGWSGSIRTANHAEGIRRVGEKVFATNSNSIGKAHFATETPGVKILAERTFSGMDLSKLHGEGNNLCVGTKNNGIFISHNLGQDWKSYNAKTLGFASSNVLVVHCDQNNFYAGTDKGLSISKDNGATWKTYLNEHKIYGVYAKDGNVWAATEKELFSSKDNGAHWDSQKLALGDYTMVFFPVYKEYNESEHGETPPDFTPEDSKQEIAHEAFLSNEDLIDAILSKPKDAYQRILGVSIEEHDCKVIKKAYGARSLKFHPDKNIGNEEAKDAFVLLSAAYESLSKECS